MAQVTYEDPIHHLSGRISKKFRTTYCYRTQGGCKYTQVHGKRTTKPNEDELARQEKFASVVTRTRARLLDPTKMAADQAAFAAQTKYKSLYQYVFNQEWNA